LQQAYYAQGNKGLVPGDIVNKILQFLRESKEELLKVTWPDRDEVTSFTMVVLITVVVISVFLWMVDTGLLALINQLMK
jgi:preprotein translocase subunit SecE